MAPTPLRRVRYSVAALLIATAAACVDSPTTPSPASDVLGAVGTAQVGEGELIICKVTVGGDASFVLDWTIASVASGQVTLSNGQCATVATGISGIHAATVTEQVPPANWSLTNITVDFSNGTSGGSINIPGRTASANVSHDRGALFTFTNTFTPPPPPPPGCTRTQGYWKNHPGDWDEVGDGKPFLTTTTFYNSGLSYLTILQTPPAGGNAYLQLAHQFIAASLNLNGAASGIASVDAAIAGAHAYFTGAPAGIPNPSGALRSQLQAWATTLDNFNNGIIGPGHCP
jgi:hypothetical protein